MTLKSNKIVPVLQFAQQKGLNADQVGEALDQLTALVEAASEAKPPTLTTVKTAIGTLGDGRTLVVGWDTCGACLLHVSRCQCAKGPVQPNYVKKFVEEFEAGQTPTPVGSLEIGEGGLSPERGSDSGQKPVSPVQDGPEGVPSGTRSRASCKSCGKPVLTGPDNANADRNDDGSWSCFSCQEGGV